MRGIASAGIVLLCLIGQVSTPVSTLAADNAAAKAQLTAAWNLYNMRYYPQAADAFDTLLRTSQCDARVYYYAALSNQAAKREARAKELFAYIATNFHGTAEAQNAMKVLTSMQQKDTPAATPAPSDELPDSVKKQLSPDMQAMLKTQSGKVLMASMMAQNAGQVKAIREAEKKGAQSKTAVASAVPAATRKPSSIPEHPFTAADIAKDGANGIDQFRYPNCWFEASMAALAQLPRGQRLLASMIRHRDTNYIVRFPNDGVEYVISDQDVEQSEIHDRALWASIIECAQIQKFPDNQGANGAENDESRLVVGLRCITGCKAEELNPMTCSDQELSSFIGGAVKSQNPIVCATLPAGYVRGPMLVIPQHAYTVIDLDPARDMVVIRNPHGRNSDRFELPNDRTHQKFEQLDDGIIKISIPLFKTYFFTICRSFI